MADTTLYKQIVLEWGQDTDSLLWGMGYSPDNGEHFYVLNTTYGRKYRQEDGDRIWPFLKDKVKSVLDWSAITGKPDVALKSDVAAVSAVASSANAKANSNAKLIAGKASQADLNSVSSTASSALDKATSNSNALASKVNKSDLVWTNITNRPDFDSVASQASQAVVTANTAQSQASAAGQAASSASAQASAAKASADTATATANAAKASASTASATAASAQQVANSASASASATAVALKSKADTDTVNAQFTAVNSSVASAQSTADSAVAGLNNKLDKTALTWGNIANKPTNLATTDSVAKAQSAANSAVSMASGATATADSAKSAATSAAGVANTANTTANSALTKANSAVSVASQANSNASSAVNTANSAKSTADSANNNANDAVSVANSAKSTADSANTNANNAVNTANQAVDTANSVDSKVSDIQTNGGGRNLLVGTRDFSGDWLNLGTNFTKTGDTYNGLSVLETNGDWAGAAQYYQVKKGETYTFSLFARYTSGTGSSGIYVMLNNNPENGFTQAWVDNTQGGYSLDTSWKKCRITFTATTDGYIKPRMERGVSNTNTLQICGYMLEKGAVAHDWSPAPEDIQSEIDANKTAAANAQMSASNAQNTANSALSKANSNATALNNKVNKSDLTWANISGKPSIPDNDATTTVSSGDLNNYTTTGKYYMPNSLSYYANHPTTGIDMGNWFVMKVDSYIGGTMIIQTIYQINSGDVWIRQLWDNSWKSWRQINFWG